MNWIESFKCVLKLKMASVCMFEAYFKYIVALIIKQKLVSYIYADS